MILEQQRLFFRILFVVLEDERVVELARLRAYGRITLLSYQPLSLPGFSCSKKDTALISLTDSLEDIFAHFNKTTRNEIRQAERMDELSAGQADHRFSEAYRLYESFEYARGAVPLRRDAFNKSFTFLTSCRGEPIAGVFVYCGGPYIRIQCIFSKRHDNRDPDFKSLVSKATRLLIWKIIQFGKDNDFASFDLASVNKSNPETASIARFKMSFGGQVVPEYTYTKTKALFRLFEGLIGVRLFAKRLFFHVRP